jgi:hypothetical protein
MHAQLLAGIQSFWNFVQHSRPRGIVILVNPVEPVRSYAIFIAEINADSAQQSSAVAPSAQLFGGMLPALKHSSFSLRPQFSPITAQSTLASYVSRRSYATSRRLGPTVPRRYLWKSTQSSLLKWMPPAAVPNLISTARVMILEREANSAPSDVSKQIALWEGLIGLNTPVGYERITSKWERLLALVNNCSELESTQTDPSPGPF